MPSGKKHQKGKGLVRILDVGCRCLVVMSSYALVCRFYRLFRSWVRGPEVVVLIISSAREGTTRQGTHVGFSLRLVLPVYVRGYFEQSLDSFVKEGVIKEPDWEKGVTREVVVAGVWSKTG